MNTKKLALLLPSVMVALIILILILGLKNRGNMSPKAMQAKPVPTFTLQNLTMETQLTETLFITQDSNHYTLLNIWASWCVVCKNEHPFLLTLAKQGINIVGLNYRDNQQAALSVLKNTGNPYQHVIFDPLGSLALDLGVIGTPETYLINNEGKIVARLNGEITQNIWVTTFKPFISTLTSNKG